MFLTRPGPQLLGLLVAVLLSLLGWGFWQYEKHRKTQLRIEWNDVVLVGFLIFSVFTLSLFGIYFFHRTIP